MIWQTLQCIYLYWNYIELTFLVGTDGCEEKNSCETTCCELYDCSKCKYYCKLIKISHYQIHTVMIILIFFKVALMHRAHWNATIAGKGNDFDYFQ